MKGKINMKGEINMKLKDTMQRYLSTTNIAPPVVVLAGAIDKEIEIMDKKIIDMSEQISVMTINLSKMVTNQLEFVKTFNKVMTSTKKKT